MTSLSLRPNFQSAFFIAMRKGYWVACFLWALGESRLYAQDFGPAYALFLTQTGTVIQEAPSPGGRFSYNVKPLIFSMHQIEAGTFGVLELDGGMEWLTRPLIRPFASESGDQGFDHPIINVGVGQFLSGAADRDPFGFGVGWDLDWRRWSLRADETSPHHTESITWFGMGPTARLKLGFGDFLRMMPSATFDLICWPDRSSDIVEGYSLRLEGDMLLKIWRQDNGLVHHLAIQPYAHWAWTHEFGVGGTDLDPLKRRVLGVKIGYGWVRSFLAAPLE